jgi:hypothetical protein
MLPPWLSLGLIAARAAEDWDGSTFYFGDLHAHSGVSTDGGSSDLGGCDECGATRDAFAIARSNGLDFVAFTEHNYSPEEAFDEFQELVRDHNDPAGGFLTIPGAEISFRSRTQVYGHKNAYVFSDDPSLHVRLADFPPDRAVDGCAGIWQGADELSALGPTLLFAHHPAGGVPMPTDWSCHDPRYEAVVEVISEHGNSLQADTDYSPIREIVAESTVHHALETFGLELGFIGSTDNHMTHAGSVCELDTMKTRFPYGGALAMLALPKDAAFTRRAIYDEMVARRTLATTGPRMPVSVRWAIGTRRIAGLGESIRLREDESVGISVSVPPAWAPVVDAVRLVGYEDRIAIDEVESGLWSATIDPLDLGRWRYVEVEIDGAAVYGAEDVCVDGAGGDRREFVWSSPDWFVLTDDVDLDGVPHPVDCDDDDDAVFPGAPEVWYDGVDQDCDGASDYDADCDGADATGFGGSDCDDSSAEICPGAEERWYDDVDQDCDGRSDHDQDLDGYDREASGGADCDDLEAAIFPGAAEVWYDGVDQDCDRGSDYDADQDGVDAAGFGGGDCDDHDAAVWTCPEDAQGGCAHARLRGLWIAALVMLAARRSGRKPG